MLSVTEERLCRSQHNVMKPSELSGDSSSPSMNPGQVSEPQDALLLKEQILPMSPTKRQESDQPQAGCFKASAENSFQPSTAYPTEPQEQGRFLLLSWKAL